jgi:hypothetical protein
MPLQEHFPGGLPPRPDAVNHEAGYAGKMLVPDNETFRSNKRAHTTSSKQPASCASARSSWQAV